MVIDNRRLLHARGAAKKLIEIGSSTRSLSWGDSMKMWDSKGYWLKAEAYIDKANSVEHSKPEFALWSALALELLARSVLTRVHPTLNADPREYENLLYALGFDIQGQPKSIPIHSVYIRLEKIVKGFSKPEREFCEYISLIRNQELQTAELAFSGLKTSKWLPQFYRVCKILCSAIKKDLTEFLGREEVGAAKKLILELGKKQEIAVKKKVGACRKAFAGKTLAERNKLKVASQLETALLSYGAKQESCPACGCYGALTGEEVKQLAPVYDEGQLFVDVEFQANKFRCLACGLVFGTVNEITLTEMEPRFTEKTSTSLHEHFQPEYEPEYENM